ncbi:MAG: antibiotic biosynthesis monooxygenase [Actinobacteria bacterium]|uniref:Unannotated protein n=1 Tax=freshwater metagenome TaxID=449393 RepID=A0A6J7T2T5_9ZZZZ|nr:antibiotic biosynthesis monooxygenase [Actinomycetota bacterium]
MILEIANMEILSHKHEEFEGAIKNAVETVLSTAKGFNSFQLQHCIEDPNKYTLLIHWDTLEDHTVTFRESELFPLWRSRIEAFFASKPEVNHWSSVFVIKA